MYCWRLLLTDRLKEKGEGIQKKQAHIHEVECNFDTVESDGAILDSRKYEVYGASSHAYRKLQIRKSVDEKYTWHDDWPIAMTNHGCGGQIPQHDVIALDLRISESH